MQCFEINIKPHSHFSLRIEVVLHIITRLYCLTESEKVYIFFFIYFFIAFLYIIKERNALYMILMLIHE